MSNATTLRNGTKKAKQIIARHLYNQVLVPMARKIMMADINRRIALGHNMTGNTINSYAIGIYVNGALIYTETPNMIPSPLRHKLNKGERFRAGSQRWDEEIQQNTFKAKVSTNGSTEPERSIAFLRSFNAPAQGFTIVICNGVEYATFQENAMNIDVLTSSFNDTKMFANTYFIPMN